MSKHALVKAGLGGALLLSPLAAFAQNLGNIQNLVVSIGNIVNLMLPIAVMIALLVFFWGLIQYIRAAGNPEEAAKGKSIMIYGVIALFIMVSIWGIVRFIGQALNIQQGTNIDVPGVRR